MKRVDNLRDRNFPDTRIRFRFSRLPGASCASNSGQIKEFRRRAAASGLPFCGNNVPKMSFGPALAENCSSRCEFADLYLYDFASGEEAFEKISQFDDGNYSLLSAERVPVFFPSVEAAANAAKYSVSSEIDLFDTGRLNKFLCSKELVFARVKSSGKTQSFDVRALCLAAEIKDCGKKFEFVISVSQGANLKPEEVMKSIFGQDVFPSDKALSIERTELYWINSKGEFEVF